MVRLFLQSCLLLAVSFTTLVAAESFTSPSAGSTLTAGEQTTLKWTGQASDADEDDVTILLCHGNGICTDGSITTTNSGSLNWTPSSTLSSRDDYFLQIIDGTENVATSGTFSIKGSSSSSSTSSSSSSGGGGGASSTSSSSDSSSSPSSSTDSSSTTSGNTTPTTTSKSTPSSTSAVASTTSRAAESNKPVSSVSIITSLVATTVTAVDSSGRTSTYATETPTAITTIVPVTDNSGNNSSSSSKSNTGAIVGGAVGGGVGALIILGLLFFLYRRHRNKKNVAATTTHKKTDLEAGAGTSKGEKFGEKAAVGGTLAGAGAGATSYNEKDIKGIRRPSGPSIGGGFAELPAQQQEPIEIMDGHGEVMELDGREIERPETPVDPHNLRRADRDTPGIRLSTPAGESTGGSTLHEGDGTGRAQTPSNFLPKMDLGDETLGAR